MNEYMKPDYEVMVFEANEYVAACPWVEDTDLTIGCGDGRIDIELDTRQGQFTVGVDKNAKTYDIWTASYEIPNDNGTTSKTNAMLYPVFQQNKDGYTAGDGDKLSEFTYVGYGFTGSIFPEHTPEARPGENKGLSASSADTANKYFLGTGYSEANGNTGFQWVVADFHLLTFLRNKDLS